MMKLDQSNQDRNKYLDNMAGIGALKKDIVQQPLMN